MSYWFHNIFQIIRTHFLEFSPLTICEWLLGGEESQEDILKINLFENNMKNSTSILWCLEHVYHVSPNSHNSRFQNSQTSHKVASSYFMCKVIIYFKRSYFEWINVKLEFCMSNHLKWWLESYFNTKSRAWMSIIPKVRMSLSIMWRICWSDVRGLMENALKWNKKW